MRAAESVLRSKVMPAVQHFAAVPASMRGGKVAKRAVQQQADSSGGVVHAC